MLQKVGAFIITVCLFIQVAVIPYLVGYFAFPGEPEILAPLIRWFLGLGIILLGVVSAFTVGVCFCLIHQKILDWLNIPW